mmetsp:Transcript_20382/g.60881  ORF Transcript_20382/g.60881 Transcript_20382/m.60881 type:complete len:384 (+) Transcript_20382:36-1187(+)
MPPARAWRCPSRTTHYVAIGRAKAVKIDLHLSTPLTPHTQPDAAGPALPSSAAPPSPWFGEGDWAEVLEVIKMFLYEQITAATLGSKEAREPQMKMVGGKVVSIAVMQNEDSTLTLLQPLTLLTRESRAGAVGGAQDVRMLTTQPTGIRVRVAPDPAAPKVVAPLLGRCDSDSAADLEPTRSKRPAAPGAAGDVVEISERAKRARIDDGDPRPGDPMPFTLTTEGGVDLAHLPTELLAARVQGIVKELWAIYSGKLKSWRHDEYRKKGKAREDLKLKVRFGTFTDSQQETFLDALTRTFCKKGTKFLNYVMDVLMPEAMTRVTAGILGVSFDAAELYLREPSSLDATTLAGYPQAAAAAAAAATTVKGKAKALADVIVIDDGE